MGSILSGATATTGGLLGLATGAGQQGLAALAPQQANLIPNITTAQNNVNSNIANQGTFAQALQTQMNGGGPNLAGSLLSNATGTNVANTAALIASQRGSSSNAGLAARNAATVGAGTQQQATGQAAAIRQQQQLNAQSGLNNVYNSIGTEAGNNLNTNQSALTAQNTGINTTNQINSGIGGSNAANKSAQLSSIAGSAQSAIGTGGSSGGSGGSGASGGDGGASAGDSGISDMSSGLDSIFAKGGEVDGNSETTETAQPAPSFSQPLDEHLQTIANIYHPQMTGSSVSTMAPGYAKGGAVKALVSPGERIIKPDTVKAVADGKVDAMKTEKVPGKPKVPGAKDSYANDTVPKKLAVGSVVIPRHITQGKNPSQDSARFVQAIIEKQGKKKKS